MFPTAALLAACAALPAGSGLWARAEAYSFDDGTAFLTGHCLACHQGAAASSQFRIDALLSRDSFSEQPQAWELLAARIANHDMPPKGAPQPALEERVQFVDWVGGALRRHACSADFESAPNAARRLNRDEYSATVRDLFDIQLDVSGLFPADGPGGEGFDNAGETLFISPLLAEKYLEAARFVADAASKEFKARARIFVVQPGGAVTEEEAARRILARFLPSAFRRPVDDRELADYLRLFRAARRRGLDFEPAVFFALRSALVSPAFLFHARLDGADAAARQHALASRLSYFLWGSMPDEFLFDLAAAGKMDDPAVLDRLVPRMLRDDRALEFSTRFVEQWLRTRELEGPNGPDAELFPEYAEDAEVRGDILLQPVFFFREVLRENRSVLDFLDSDGTVLTRPLIAHLNLPIEKKQDGKNPNWMALPPELGRGGLLSMPAIAAVTSHAHRTSPVLRGVWILDAMLGTPPPPPPPDVPELEEPASDATAHSVRELLAAHSGHGACASCHDRIDPLGFALEHYDVLGRWRESEAGGPIDASGSLPDGTLIEGPQGLKRALLDRRELFLRNLAKRMLGYALGRGLALSDTCAVEIIVRRVAESEFSSWALVREIVRSDSFLASRIGTAGAQGESNEHSR